jgi:hypothetical protein
MLYATTVVGYALTHFGNVQDTPGEDYDFWWVALCFTAIINNGMLLKNVMFIKRQKSALSKDIKRGKYLTFEFIIFLFIGMVKSLCLGILPLVMLFSNASHDAKRYMSAINVILACFELMLTFSRLPTMGIYIFMFQKVCVSIFRFFASYIWHFFGYAIAFHILMPASGAFSNIGDSFIKVCGFYKSRCDFCLRPSTKLMASGIGMTILHPPSLPPSPPLQQFVIFNNYFSNFFLNFFLDFFFGLFFELFFELLFELFGHPFLTPILDTHFGHQWVYNFKYNLIYNLIYNLKYNLKYKLKYKY